MPLVCTVNYGEHSMFWDFSGASGIGTSPFKAGGASLIPGQVFAFAIPYALWPRNQSMPQKQYCNKFNKDFFLMCSFSTLRKNLKKIVCYILCDFYHNKKIKNRFIPLSRCVYNDVGEQSLLPWESPRWGQHTVCPAFPSHLCLSQPLPSAKTPFSWLGNIRWSLFNNQRSMCLFSAS